MIEAFSMVGGEGIEPSHSCEYGILSPARLPIPPPARVVHYKGMYQRCIVLYLSVKS